MGADTVRVGLVGSIRALPGAARQGLRAVHLAADQAVDRLRDVETTDEVELATLGLAGEHRIDYQASGWRDLRSVLPRSSVGRRDVFVDLGSGKGRILLEAGRYPFGRVIGVELSGHLNEIAARNIAGERERLRCGDVELVTADASEYRLPDDVTVAYLYNPFQGPVFQRVANQLVASVDRWPRRLVLIYRNPVEHDRLLHTGRFRLVQTKPGLRPGRRWSELTTIRVYELD